MKKKQKPSNRNAISAEAYGKWNKKEDFKPRIIPKNVQQKEKIRSKLMASFLFRALDKQAVEIVINAMDIVYPRPGEYVIAEGDEGDNLYVVEEGTLDCTKLFVYIYIYIHLSEYRIYILYIYIYIVYSSIYIHRIYPDKYTFTNASV